ncbi:sortase A [Arcanobacterium wilhelmae]|uniref:Sortase A n=1 Tax=Arcanobacterium wilhelmae TaxID=1803177 RepID=A0ABT9N9T1_9ACTO|nr:class C sortase [Arcanobacterium wilhelmae]MDP9800455.1 sortase A [Arcanobacterium wilhelmae]WFN89875.1 class C sortase [Arcanobacterium wilhelmae]
MSLTEISARKSEVKTEKPKKKSSMLVPALVILLGIAILLYPIVSTQWNNYQQQQAAAEYAKFVKKADTKALEKSLEEAHRYNAERTVGPILDPWTERLADDNEPYKEYLAQLNVTGVMARLVIPSIKADLPVFHGTRPDTLEKGIGHLFGTDLPVGGPSTHSVLTGHTGLQTATLFDNLDKMKKGDSIYIDVAGEKLRYVVSGTEVVLPDEAENLYKVEGRDLLTLITCTPYGVNSHRLLVHAERAPMDDAGKAALEDGVGTTIQWWMWAFGGVALLAVLALVFFMMKSRRRNKDDQADVTSPNAAELPQAEAQPATDVVETGDDTSPTDVADSAPTSDN